LSAEVRHGIVSSDVVQWYLWVAFIAFILAVLAIDLGIFHRRAHAVPFREAATWTGVWVALSLSMAALLAVWRGSSVAAQYLAGYLIEWTLSVDNVFVFVLIFTFFAVPAVYQHRVLFWGVLGAICLRLGFILAGAALLDRFHWVTYAFGALLLLTAWRFLRETGRERSLEESRVLGLIRRVIPMGAEYQGQRFIARVNGRTVATPLLAVLLMVEAADVVFAIDSIPAIFSVTRDPFVVFASNALAILGLRSLYFVLAGAVGRFRYLKPSLAILLAFVGVKMLLSDVVEVPTYASLAVIVAILGAGIIASALHPEPKPAEPAQPPRREVRGGGPAE
jgi:TerC family integral membrane protein